MMDYNEIPDLEKAYERTIRQIAKYPLNEHSKLAIELLLKRTKAKRRKQKIENLWDMK
jgi:hypothetical protein